MQTPRFAGLAALLLLACPGPSRADQVQWSFSTFAFPGTVRPDTPGNGLPVGPPWPPWVLSTTTFPTPIYNPLTGVTFTPTGGDQSTALGGTARLVLANLTTNSFSTADGPDQFKHQPFDLVVG